jgi:hypothetical protein
MNFVQLCQRLILETGTSGALTTTQNVTGEMLRMTTWVNSAWAEIQTKHQNWEWMRSSYLTGGGVSFPTVAGQAYYQFGAAPGQVGITFDQFGSWAEDSFRCFTTLAGTNDECLLDPITFDGWRDAYMYGSQRSVQTRPVAVSFGPGQAVCLGPPSNGLYTIEGDYYRAPSQMALDTDLPTGLPAQFHMLIIYQAMMMYAGYEAASEVFQRGEQGYEKLLSQLEALRLPQVFMGGALA